MLRRALLALPLLSLFAYADDRMARSPAAWVQSGVIYEINPRTFSPSGDFKGIEAGLPRLEELGVTILWLMPIHPVGQLNRKGSIGSPYAVRDYDAINPDYGTAADLKHLVTAAHRRGFKVIIDIVADHTAWDSVLMKHPEYYKHSPQGTIQPPVPDWADVAGLDYRNPELREYMAGMMERWLLDFGLDGFRCDAASMVPTDFWEATRARLEKIKPDIVMIAEANVPDLVVKAFDLDYAWPFHSTLTGVFENGAPASDLGRIWRSERDRYPKGAMPMRFSDNHDEKRAIARFGEKGALAASALVFTMDGVPMLYNGMETGDTTESGAPALFERLPVFWQIGERRPEFPRFYREIIALRKAHPALQQGEVEWVRNSEPDRILSYLRRGPDGEFLVVINCSNRPFLGLVDAAPDFQNLAELRPQPTALPSVALEAWGFRILERKRAGR
jgi:glycosidase